MVSDLKDTNSASQPTDVSKQLLKENHTYISKFLYDF